MAIHLRHTDENPHEAHEINVTPFIDVMLVLLVIFMVTAPLTTVNVPVELPSSTQEPAPRPDNPVFLTIRADQTLALGENSVTQNDLPAALDTAANATRTNAFFCALTKAWNTAP